MERMAKIYADHCSGLHVHHEVREMPVSYAQYVLAYVNGCQGLDAVRAEDYKCLGCGSKVHKGTPINLKIILSHTHCMYKYTHIHVHVCKTTYLDRSHGTVATLLRYSLSTSEALALLPHPSPHANLYCTTHLYISP